MLQTDGQTQRWTDGWSGPTPRPALAKAPQVKINQHTLVKNLSLWFSEFLFPPVLFQFHILLIDCTKM